MIRFRFVVDVSVAAPLSVGQQQPVGDVGVSIKGAAIAANDVAVVDLPRDPDEGFLKQGEVYNWPNPVRDGRTFFRLATRIDVDVRITIIDGAGTLVDRLDVGLVRAQSPVDIQWTTEVGSGLYFARVEAFDANGKSETSLIKMAVIR